VIRIAPVLLSMFASLALAGMRAGPLSAAQDMTPDVLTVHHLVSHTSTAPAIKGEQVTLYLRERALSTLATQSASLDGRVVVFVHGAALGSTGAFDAPYQDYSWMAYLASAGFDAFGLDLTGYGYSTRPGSMNDPCNLDAEAQATLVPALQVETCPGTKPVQIDTLRSDWDDLDSAVNFVRDQRHVERVSLVGWSYGGSIVSGYAARHRDKVDRLVMLSPTYDVAHPDASVPEAPAGGPPMFLQTSNTVPSFWDPQVQCADQFDPRIRDALWQEGVTADAVSWAPGLRRVPSFPTWIWNRSIASQVQMPALVVVGEFDHMSDRSVPEVIRTAYGDLGTQSKVFAELACSSHFAMWETRHLALFQASLEWLRDGSVNGVKAGTVRLGD